MPSPGPVKTYYDMLDVGRTASVDEIRRSFRREIAKYHPDKVQHLGAEFQEIAATKAAELTQAYQTLTDERLRADYDALLDNGGPPRPAAPSSAAPPEPAAVRSTPNPPPPGFDALEPPPASGPPGFSQDRAGASDLVRKATVLRFRQALDSEFGSYDQPPMPGFDVTCVPKPAFWKLKLPPRVLGRFVAQVNGAAVSEAWAMASRMKKDGQRDVCVFIMGPAVAAAGELAAAIAERRRKSMPAGGKLIVVPVDTRTWDAHVPSDAPPVVKSLLARLKSA